MRCIVFTLAFDSSPIKGEGDSVGWFGLVHPRHPPCGYCLKASTSLRHGRIQQVLSVALPSPPLWIADQVRNDGVSRPTV